MTEKHFKILFELLLSSAIILAMTSFALGPGSDRLFFFFFALGFVLLITFRDHDLSPPSGLVPGGEVEETGRALETLIYVTASVGYIFLAFERFLSVVL